jgi:glycosyltransferase involved in cell wall biosynthesis
MKVLHVLPSYEPAWAAGGIITATSNLCQALVKQGLQVTVYTTGADGLGGKLSVPLGQPVDRGGVKVWYFPYEIGGLRAFYSRALSIHLAKTIKDFDLVHLAGLWQYLSFTAAVTVRAENRPLVVAPHSSLMKHSFYEVGARFWKKVYWTLFGEKIIRQATAVQFLCEGEREESTEFCSARPSFIVPNGLEPDKYKKDEGKRTDLRKRLSIPGQAFVLLYSGRINSKKQIELVIKALPVLLARGIEAFFVLVGPVDNQKYYRKLKDLASKLKVENYLRWAGFVSYDQIVGFYSAADVMVLPSLAEGVSMSSTEAMAASLPLVISDRVANYKEIEADGAGLVVKPEADSLVEALLEIALNQKVREKLSEAARQSVLNRYEINAVASLMVKAYEDILSGRRSPELRWG